MLQYDFFLLICYSKYKSIYQRDWVHMMPRCNDLGIEKHKQQQALFE